MRYIEIDLTEKEFEQTEPIFAGENNATTLKLLVPDELLGYSYGLLFKLNNGVTRQQLGLTLDSENYINYSIVNTLIEERGTLSIQMVIFDEDELIKSYKFTLEVSDALFDNGLIVLPSNPTQTIEYIDFDLTPSEPSNTIGRIEWSAIYNTLTVGLGSEIGSLELGQELLIYVRNDTAENLSQGTPVIITGSTGDYPTIAKATNDGTVEQSYVIGVVGGASGIAKNSNGFVICQAVLNKVNTLAFQEGDLLWLGTNGTLTKTMPTGSANVVFMGWCIKRSADGKILFKIIRHPNSNEISIIDTANWYTATLLESVLAEIGAKLADHESRISILEQ